MKRLSRRRTIPAAFSSVVFSGRGPFLSETRHKEPFLPKFPVLNGVNIYDPTQYSLGFGDTENDSIFERDAVGDISLSKQYSIGGYFSTFEIGFKGREATKRSLVGR